MRYFSSLRGLAKAEPGERRAALRQLLSEEKLPFLEQGLSPAPGSPLGVLNFLFSSAPGSGLLSPSGGRLLFTAHYDSFPGSPGANDNLSSVLILLALYQALQEREIPADFALLDGEEQKHSGGRLYLERAESLPRAVLTLDLCGYGDSIVLSGKGHERKPVFRRFLRPALLGKHNAQLVGFLPEGDEICFRKQRIPALSLSLVPRWDIQYLRTLASYGEGLLGRPPEFEMILSQMEVMQTMHNGAKDSPEYVEETAMEQVLLYLLEAMTEEPEKESLPEKLRRIF